MMKMLIQNNEKQSKNSGSKSSHFGDLRKIMFNFGEYHIPGGQKYNVQGVNDTKMVFTIYLDVKNHVPVGFTPCRCFFLI